VLLAVAGGPEVGRLRALRRLLKTLVADVYLLERDGAVRGVVAVVYRRSLAQGGLVATIDALELLGESSAVDRAGDAKLLAACALSRAERRGCVAVDAAITAPEAVAAIEGAGFAAVAPQRWRSLRSTAARGRTAVADAPEKG